MAKIQIKIDAFLGKNKDLVEKIDMVNKQQETAEEMKKKGTSANIELKKLINWNQKKQEKIDELKDTREKLEKEKLDMEKRIHNYENQLATIEENHAKNCKILNKNFSENYHKIKRKNFEP